MFSTFLCIIQLSKINMICDVMKLGKCTKLHTTLHFGGRIKTQYLIHIVMGVYSKIKHVHM